MDIKKEFGISDRIYELVNEAEKEISEVIKKADEIYEQNQMKVVLAMQKHRLSEADLGQTTGYGYNDNGRDKIEDIYAEVFGAECGLVRQQVISGTHALTVALFGNLRPGDELVSVVGAPYDTLEGVIGYKREVPGSLKEHGVSYKEVPFTDEGKPDHNAISKVVSKKTKLVLIQRSKGYQFRDSLTIGEVKKLIDHIKSIDESIICMVDNCYCEFVSDVEPPEVGADITVGSLIKNPGGGLAPVGGYIVGKKEYVENAAYRLTVPGMGKEVGPSLGITQSIAQGLFLAPSVVNGAVKGATLAAKVFEKLGYSANPASGAERADIVEAISLNSPEAVEAFCRGIQKAAPVDSFVTPTPWDMPGYDCKVIMAAGAFVQGASIELSADAPMKPPYTVYFQGGLTFAHIKLGIMLALKEMGI